MGKSSLVGRFVHGSFNPNLTTTLGASFMAKTIVVDNITYRFQIWDTAGQERYRSLLPMYYRNAAAAIVVYDITEERTFGVLKTWINELQRHGPDGIVLAIAGNKSDLEEKRMVRRHEGEEVAEHNTALFIETSALTASNVEELFVEISKRLPKPSPLGESDKVVQLSNEKVEGSSHCCGKK